MSHLWPNVCRFPLDVDEAFVYTACMSIPCSRSQQLPSRFLSRLFFSIVLSLGWMIPRSKRGLWGLFVHCAHILWVVSCRQAHGIDPRAFLNEECFLITAQLPSIATQPSFDPSTHRCRPPPSSACRPLNDRARTSVRSSFSFPFAFGLSF